MTTDQEIKMQASRDEKYLSEAKTVWNGDVKSFCKNYANIQQLYNGTSFQKKYYPKQYQDYLNTLKH